MYNRLYINMYIHLIVAILMHFALFLSKQFCVSMKSHGG